MLKAESITNLVYFALGTFCAAAVLSSCEPARSDGTASAIRIPSPVGVTCYAIVVGAEMTPVGGNCLATGF